MGDPVAASGGPAPSVTIDTQPFTRTVTCTGSYTLTGTATDVTSVAWAASPSGESGACTGTTSWSCAVAVSPDASGQGVETVSFARRQVPGAAQRVALGGPFEQDPIARFGVFLLDQKFAKPKDLEAIDKDVNLEVDDCVTFADESPWPPAEYMYEDIYVKTPHINWRAVEKDPAWELSLPDDRVPVVYPPHVTVKG